MCDVQRSKLTKPVSGLEHLCARECRSCYPAGKGEHIGTQHRSKSLTTSNGTPDKEGCPSSACSSNLAVSNLSLYRCVLISVLVDSRVASVHIRQWNLPRSFESLISEVEL